MKEHRPCRNCLRRIPLSCDFCDSACAEAFGTNRPESDPVNSPAHYTQGGIECIDAIRAAMSPEEFRGFLRGNALKYLWRMHSKGKPAEDARKAEWYLSWLQAEVDA